jgi:phospholipid/cholesterol/gamma-HCH transport system permease protein
VVVTADSAAGSAGPVEIERSGPGLVLRGRLDREGAGSIWERALELARDGAEPELVLDASQLSYCDAAGAALLDALREERESQGGSLRLEGLREEFAGVFALIEPRAQVDSEAPAVERNPIALLGAAAREYVVALADTVAYIGHLCRALAGLVRNPGQLRGRDVMLVAERAGIGAVPIVSLIGFLLGLILAFQSAIPMQRFGAEVFVADLLALSLLRELGPLMAAILLAARSGSAFAAEIGTMKVNEEVDALTTMGLEPMRFLILPRVVAAMIVVPVLTMFTHLSGLIGGAVVFLSLGFPLAVFVNRVAYAAVVGDFLGGMLKAFVFGIIVAAVGCQRGLDTGKGAGAVGLSTTSSVVTGITLIAIFDGAFAVLFYNLGI